jgi:hypothetical protein
MKYKFLILILFLWIFFIQFTSAAHYVVGIVENARNGMLADGHSIFLWNPSEGTNDNITDVIGQFGNAGVSGFYMIDCELLNNGCNISSILSLRVINNGDNYVSEIRNVTITGAGFDVVTNITLNSPPTTSLVYPANNQNISTQEVNFNCSIDDPDSNLANVTLYGNWSGGWHANETKSVAGNQKYVIFTKTLSQGVYYYGCKATDNLSTSNFSQQNNTFTIDLTKPVITSVQINQSYFCGISSRVRVNCTATDEILRVNKVVIQAITPGYIINYSGNLLMGNIYYADVLINQTTSWSFNCIVNDSAGNENNLTSASFTGYSSSPEIYINYQTIFLNNSNPVENQTIVINSSIENLGCANANNVVIGYFIGDPSAGGINIGNDTVSVNSISTLESKISWKAKIGKNNIFILADFNYTFNEDNETNNKANKTFSINSWQEIYGNVTINKIVGAGQFNLTNWINETSLNGNIFVTDSECNINWLTLQSIGKKINGIDSLNDFSDMDSILGMESFDDSISNEFSNYQIPKQTNNFLIHQKNVVDVPVINSTDSSKFMTGILWDYSDDSGNAEYDPTDKEDIVFIGKINKTVSSTYGTYDYELKIPAKLREYKTADSSNIYFYYDLN